MSHDAFMALVGAAVVGGYWWACKWLLRVYLARGKKNWLGNECSYGEWVSDEAWPVAVYIFGAVAAFVGVVFMLSGLYGLVVVS